MYIVTLYTKKNLKKKRLKVSGPAPTPIRIRAALSFPLEIRISPGIRGCLRALLLSYGVAATETRKNRIILPRHHSRQSGAAATTDFVDNNQR